MMRRSSLPGLCKRTHELVQLQYNTYNRSAVPSLEHVTLLRLSARYEKPMKEQAEYVIPILRRRTFTRF